MAHLEVLESELRRFQLDLPTEQKITLSRYCDELERWNNKINLTGLNGPEMVRRLVVEPVWIGLQLKPSGALVDIGSGNGSPAIPLHIVSNFQNVHLIEARAKRAAFLRHVVLSLQLPNVSVHRTRFEEVAADLGSVHWVSLRGMSLTSELIDKIGFTFKTTTVVWITAGDWAPILPSEILEVPITNTKILIFRLDLS